MTRKQHIRLSPEDRAKVATKFLAGVTREELAAAYKVSARTIDNILDKPTPETGRDEEAQP